MKEMPILETKIYLYLITQCFYLVQYIFPLNMKRNKLEYI